MSGDLREQIEALPVHSWDGYEWEWSCSDDYHGGETMQGAVAHAVMTDGKTTP